VSFGPCSDAKEELWPVLEEDVKKKINGEVAYLYTGAEGRGGNRRASTCPCLTVVAAHCGYHWGTPRLDAAGTCIDMYMLIEAWVKSLWKNPAQSLAVADIAKRILSHPVRAAEGPSACACVHAWMDRGLIFAPAPICAKGLWLPGVVNDLH
jgi:hypothetical protein